MSIPNIPSYYLPANWSAPATIRALTTTRAGGVSNEPFAYNNLGLYTGDNACNVLTNRLALTTRLTLPNEPEWLEQTHTNTCVVVEKTDNRQSDAAITRDKTRVLAIMTADCLPILLCCQQGTEIAAIHAGWRGLAQGIIENTVCQMHTNPVNILAWIGPAICYQCYEVGSEVYKAYQQRYPFANNFFNPSKHKWNVNLAGLAAAILTHAGITRVYQSNVCTFENTNDYYSYRRNAQTGRMASLIWFNSIT
jgi:YfiH family protein